MNKMIIAGMTVLSLAAQAQQSSSTLSAPASQTQTTTTTLSAAKPAEASKWSGGMTFIYEQAARVKAFEGDTETAKFDTQLHLKTKYKYNKNNSIGLNQRVFYSEYVEGYDGAALGNLRVDNVTTGMKAGSADASLLSRLTLPTRAEDRRDSNYLGAITMVPELSWTINPRVSTSASLYSVVSLYGDTNNKKPAAGAARNYFILMPGTSVSYNFSDSLSVSGSLAYSFVKRLRAAGLSMSESIETGVSLGYQATKKINVSAGINQSIPTLEGSFNPVTGKALAFEGSSLPQDMTIGARDQTVYELTGSIAF